MNLELISNNEIIISAGEFAKCVYLSCDDSTSQFSDNYFDLLPGETKIVKLIPVKSENPIDKDAYQNVKEINFFDLK